MVWCRTRSNRNTGIALFPVLRKTGHQFKKLYWQYEQDLDNPLKSGRHVITANKKESQMALQLTEPLQFNFFT
jgi:hypothetical protein